ncbi:AMP-binding protein [Paraburkholderia sp. CNPSo 3155]|uniref:class I adenylate-forming enzyme family protein n=1 Tax=Paraburkholderia atlantica TaxID=2654982 RepID=UPI00128DCB89|nr:AMP-binding protein [Paraburkholderia atlantica]MPW11170.1 AMP-binding protein [Paraburkholderia atlantica]
MAISLLNRVDVAAFARRGTAAHAEKTLLSDHSRALTGGELSRVVARLVDDIRNTFTSPGGPLAIAAEGDALLIGWWAIIQSGHTVTIAEKSAEAVSVISRTELSGPEGEHLGLSELRFSVEELLSRQDDDSHAQSGFKFFDHDAASYVPFLHYAIPRALRATRPHRAIAFTAAVGNQTHGGHDASWLIATPLQPVLVESIIAGAWTVGVTVRLASNLASLSTYLDGNLPTVIIADLDSAESVLAKLPKLATELRLNIVVERSQLASIDAHAERLAQYAIENLWIRYVWVDPVLGYVALRELSESTWLPASTVAFAVAGPAEQYASDAGAGRLLVRTPQASQFPGPIQSFLNLYAGGWFDTGVIGQLGESGFVVNGTLNAGTIETSDRTAAEDERRATKFSLADLFERASKYRQDGIAIKAGDKSIDYRLFRKRVDALAISLEAKLNVKPGERVGLLSRNRPEFIELYWALNSIRAIFVPVNFRLKGPEVSYVLRDSGTTVLFYEPEYEELLSSIRAEHPDVRLIPLAQTPFEAATTSDDYDGLIATSLTDGGHRNWNDVDADDDTAATILYTAGTTGFPKGAVRTNRNVFWFAMTGSATASRYRPNVSQILSTPLFHVAGHEASMVGGLMNAAPLIVMRELNVDQLLDLIDREGVRMALFPPTVGLDVLRRLRAGSRKLDRLTHWISASAPLPAVLRDEALSYVPGVIFCNSLGMTEAGVLFRDQFQLGSTKPSNSIGRSLGTVATRIIDQEGRDVPQGEIGQIVIRSPQSINSYWCNERASAEATRDDWFNTGDLGRFSDAGDIEVMGRSKDMIISGGENVYSTEVENVLFSQSEIKEAAVFGIPHPHWGEAVVTAVVLEPGASLSEAQVIERCRAVMAHYKAPRRVFIRSSPLPRNSMGKVTKFDLQREYGDTSWEHERRKRVGESA